MSHQVLVEAKDLPRSAHDEQAVTRRLRDACRGYSCRELGEIARISGETVRRYLHLEQPGTRFLIALCRRLRISANWILLGRPPIFLNDSDSPPPRPTHTDSQLISGIATRLHVRRRTLKFPYAVTPVHALRESPFAS